MSLFQTDEIIKFWESQPGYEVVVCKSCIGDQELGRLAGLIIKEKGIKGYFSRRCIVWGGPRIGNSLSDRHKVFNDLLFEFNQKLKSKVIYTEFRNLFDISEFREIFEQFGYKFEGHLDFKHKLSISEEEMWKGIESAKRNKIRKAEKQGFVFRVSDKVSDMQKAYVLLKKLYDTIKLPLFSEQFFIDLTDKLGNCGKLKIFILESADEMVAFRLCLSHDGLLYDYYAAADQTKYRLYPNDLLPWEIMKWAKREGYHTYMFGGAGKPGVPYGVRDFKKQYGGELVNYGRFKLILNKPLYKIGELGVKLLKKYG